MQSEQSHSHTLGEGHEGEGPGLHELLRKASLPHLGKSSPHPALMMRRLFGGCGRMGCRKALPPGTGSQGDRRGRGREQGAETH